MELIKEGEPYEVKPLDSFPRATDPNPLTPEQKANSVEWKRILTQTYPNVHPDFIQTAIDYYLAVGHEQAERDIASGKFEKNFVQETIKEEEE